MDKEKLKKIREKIKEKKNATKSRA